MPINSVPKLGEALFQKVLAYLYGPEPKQAVAEVHLTSSQQRTLNRHDLVTPAVLEEAVSAAADRCLQKSRNAGKLLGLDADDIIGFLDHHYVNPALTLRLHNVAEHCPEWFAREPLQVTNVVPLAVGNRRPTSLTVR